MPIDNDLGNQKIKDRYYGVNDPVAQKMIRKAGMSSLPAPEDKEITTLYLGSLDPTVTDQDLKDQMYSYGEIKTVHHHKLTAYHFR